MPACKSIVEWWLYRDSSGYCAPKSQLSCFAEWQLWWNLIHKLYLCIMMRDGSDEDLHTKAGSGFSGHIAVCCLWAIMCIRVSKNGSTLCLIWSVFVLCSTGLVVWWNTSHTSTFALDIAFFVQPWEGIFCAAIGDISVMQKHQHTLTHTVCTWIHTPLCTLLSSSISTFETRMQRVFKSSSVSLKEYLTVAKIGVCRDHYSCWSSERPFWEIFSLTEQHLRAVAPPVLNHVVLCLVLSLLLCLGIADFKF